MIKLILEVSGYNSTIWHFFVFNPENSKLTNQRLGELFNSFGIQPGNFNLDGWVGKVGAARIKHEDYEGQPTPKVSYFISKDKQVKLEPWKEPAGVSKSTNADNFAVLDTGEDLPW